MELLVEIAIEVIGGILEGVFGEVVNFERKINVENLIESSDQQSYVVGLIATVMAISYGDDHKLDKKEKQLLIDLVKQNEDTLTKSTRKNIKYLRKHKIYKDNLSYIFYKLNIDYYMMIKITNEVERILLTSDKDTSKQLELLKAIRLSNTEDLRFNNR